MRIRQEYYMKHSNKKKDEYITIKGMADLAMKFFSEPAEYCSFITVDVRSLSFRMYAVTNGNFPPSGNLLV